jgi:AcrR family transcriptional regulator
MTSTDTSTDVRRPDRRAERHERTRAEIVAAAWRLADERGLAAWSLRDVADAVGMRPPSLYGYVDSKSALYDAMFAEGCHDLLDRIAAVPRDGSPAQALTAGARMFVDFCVERPARHVLLFLRTVPGFEPSPSSYALAEQVLRKTAEALADAGLEDPAALDLWTALLTGLASQQVSNDPGGDRWTRLVDDAVDMLLRQFSSRRGPRPSARRAAGAGNAAAARGTVGR